MAFMKAKEMQTNKKAKGGKMDKLKVFGILF